MAAVAPSHSRHYFDLPQASRLSMDPSAAAVQMVPNPDFVFPARPAQESPTKRPVSMHLNSSSHPSSSSSSSRQRVHQRQSVSTLPTFTFNATDTSGMGQSSPGLPSPTLSVPTTPSRTMGHRRRASEFVGGDSRYGVSTLVSTSPSKPSEMLPFPPDSSTTGSPARRRGHAHRRSAAMSGHDLASILQPRDVNVAPQVTFPSPSAEKRTRTPSPRPSSEIALPEESTSKSAPTFSPRINTNRPSTAHPSTRPRVGFSENVEYIPRPLSTVSSDTTSSASTVRGHSVHNSISSLISLGGVGIPSPRRIHTPPIMDLRAGTPASHRASFERRSSPEIREELWGNNGKRSCSESAGTSPSLSITFDAPDRPHVPPKKRSFLKLDRRRSEPLISAGTLEQPGLSTVSLHEPVMSGPFQNLEKGEPSEHELDRKSSRKKVKEWAIAVLGRNGSDPRKTKSMIFPANPRSSLDPSSAPDMPTQPESALEAEPDLDAVFSQESFGPVDDTTGFAFPQARPSLDNPTPLATVTKSEETEDSGHVIDLDAALGPYGTPSMSGGRRQLHSDSFTKRGTDRGHNRTYSLPTLTPFQFDRSSSPVRSSMADVFEEEEETEASMTAKATAPNASAPGANSSDHDNDTGIHVVETVGELDEPMQSRSGEHGLGIQGQAKYSRSAGSSLPPSNSPTVLRTKSVVEDTIVEEASPVEIVEDHEEPRTFLATKSSNSSEASTVLADRHKFGLSVPLTETSPSTLASYAASTFSSPDSHAQQGFFDPSRLGTSGSSVTDNRTVNSFATGEQGPDVRMSVDDVPSLTSSRSTMISAMQNGVARRDFSGHSGSIVSVPLEAEVMERRRKRSSIHSLSTLLGAPFGESRSRSPDQRPHTALPQGSHHDGKKRKEYRLSKLMFWRSRVDSRSVSSSK